MILDSFEAETVYKDRETGQDMRLTDVMFLKVNEKRNEDIWMTENISDTPFVEIAEKSLLLKTI